MNGDTLHKDVANYDYQGVTGTIAEIFNNDVSDAPGEQNGFIDIKTCLDRAEAGDAELFAHHFKDKFVFDRSEKTWFVWQGSYWEKDRLGEVRRAVVTTIAGDYAQASADALRDNRTEQAKQYQNRAVLVMTKKRADAVLDLAKDISGTSVTGDEWDSQPMLLAALNGVVDLRTGELLESKPRLYMRSHLNCEYLGVNLYSKMWDNFISDFCKGIVSVLGGNEQEVEGFIHRLFGYFATGDVREKVMPIMWGEHGYNGRTTLQETFRHVMGDDMVYTVSADILMASKWSDKSAPQPHLYAMRGKRMVFAAESKAGQVIDSGFIKQATGMDSFKTHGKYTSPVTVTPTFKFALLTNKKPHIEVDDDALWERLLLVPFGISYVSDPDPSKPYQRKADKTLGEKLKKEGSAVLAWLVRGCLEWQAQGLNPPKEVLAKTNEYRKDEDVVQQFVDDCLELDAPTNMMASDIYEKYVKWAMGNGFKPMTSKNLYKRLDKIIGESKRTNKGMRYSNVMSKLYNTIGDEEGNGEA